MAPDTSTQPSASTSVTDLSKPVIESSPQQPNEKDFVQHDVEKAGSVHQSEKQDGDGQDLSHELSRIDTSDFPSAFPLAMIVIALMLSIFLVALDMTIVATAIPRITDEFHSLDQVGWYGSAFFLTVAAFQSTWGKAYKFFPLKTTYMISILVFEVGSLICGVAQSSTTLIVGRAIAGAGGAGLASGSYTIIAFSAPPQKRPAFTGFMGATFGAASVIGPLLGGVFTTDVSWRWCFYINLPIGGLAAAFIFIFFHTPKAAQPQQASAKEKLLQMDLPGTFLIMAAAVCYLLAMQWGGTTKPWSDSSVIGCLVGFGLLVIAFVVTEFFSGDRALIQGRLLKNRTLAAMCAYIFVVAAAFFIQIYYLPIYFQAARGASASKSGIDNVPLVLSASLFTVTSGVLITIWGHYIPIMTFGSMVSAVAAGLIYTLQIDTPAPKWIGYQVLLGFGLGLTFQIPVIVAQSIVSPSDLSTVSAMVLFFQTIGGALFVSAAQAGFLNKLVDQIPITAPGVSVAKVVVTGATDLRRVFSHQQLPGILTAYMEGLRVPFALCIALGCLSFFISFTPKWQTIKVKM